MQVNNHMLVNNQLPLNKANYHQVCLFKQASLVRNNYILPELPLFLIIYIIIIIAYQSNKKRSFSFAYTTGWGTGHDIKLTSSRGADEWKVLRQNGNTFGAPRRG